MNRKLALGVASAGLALALAGCSSAGLPTTSPAASAAPTVVSTAPAPAPEPSPSLTSSHPGWGKTITLQSGLAVTLVSEPVKPGVDAYGNQTATRVAPFKVTVRNGTTGPINLFHLFLNPEVSGGADSSGIQTVGWYGHDLVMPDLPESLAPGDSFSWEWGIPDPVGGTRNVRVQYEADLPMYQGGNQTFTWAGDIQ